LEDKGPINIVFHEWKAIWKDATQKGIGWKDRWNYIFQPPGWSHTGEAQTSRVLQQKEKNLQV